MVLPFPFQRFDIETRLRPGEVLDRLHALSQGAERAGDVPSGPEESPAQKEPDRPRHIASGTTSALLIRVKLVARGPSDLTVTVSLLPSRLFWLCSGITCIFLIMLLGLGEPFPALELLFISIPLVAGLAFACSEAEGVRRLLRGALADPPSMGKRTWPKVQITRPGGPGSEGALEGILLFAFLVLAATAAVVVGPHEVPQPEARGEADGLQLSIWTAGPGFAMVAAGCMAGVAAGWGLLFLALRRRLRGAFAVCIFVLAATACELCTLALITHLNVKLDATAGEPFEIEVTDMFVMDAAYRRRSVPSGRRRTTHYLALSVPEGLRPHSLVVVPRESFKLHSIGQKFRVRRHPGRFGLPWYQFDGPIRWAAGSNWKPRRIQRVHAIQGRFSKDSPYRRDLEEYGVEIQDL